MASQAVTSGAAVNNGATVVMGGSIDSSNTVTNAPGRTHIGFHDGNRSGPTEQATANIGTQTAKGSGTFAYVMVAGQFIGKRMPGQINGIANNVLNSGGGYKGTRSAIHFLETTRVLGVNTWDYVTGAITKGGTAGDEVSFGTDDAARPSRAIPGELVYTHHSMARSGSLAVALSADYSAKTG